LPGTDLLLPWLRAEQIRGLHGQSARKSHELFSCDGLPNTGFDLGDRTSREGRLPYSCALFGKPLSTPALLTPELPYQSADLFGHGIVSLLL
jgi:hypothetical protein